MKQLTLLIAEEFNQYFSNIASNLNALILQSDESSYDFIQNCNLNSIFLSPVTESEMIGIVGKMKSCSVGSDAVPVKLLELTETYSLSAYFFSE